MVLNKSNTTIEISAEMGDKKSFWLGNYNTLLLN